MVAVFVVAMLATLNGCRIDAGGLKVSERGVGEVSADAGMRRLWSPGDLGVTPPRSGGPGSNARERGNEPAVDAPIDAADSARQADPAETADSGAEAGQDAHPGYDPVSSASAVALSRDLLLWFSFDDRATIGIELDRSGHGHRGVLRGLSTGSAWVAAAFGGALDLAADGQRGSVTVPTSGHLEGIDEELSVAVWIRLPRQQDPGVILTRQANGGGWALYRLEVKERRLKLVQADASAGPTLELMSDRLVPTERWVHLTMVIGGGTARLFLDGARVAMARWAGRTTRSVEPLTIGASQAGAGDAAVTTDHLPAQIDEFLLYRRGLSDAEVAALASGALP